jgi:hypothetical protein
VRQHSCVSAQERAFDGDTFGEDAPDRGFHRASGIED